MRLFWRQCLVALLVDFNSVPQQFSHRCLMITAKAAECPTSSVQLSAGTSPLGWMGALNPSVQTILHGLGFAWLNIHSIYPMNSKISFELPLPLPGLECTSQIMASRYCPASFPESCSGLHSPGCSPFLPTGTRTTWFKGSVPVIESFWLPGMDF